MDLSGFVLDKSKWLAVYERHEGEVERIEEELGTKYGTTVRKEKGRGKNKVWADEFILFNPASPSQVLSNLRNRGLEVDSTGDDILNGMLLSADCSAPDREFIEQIIQYRGAAKKASTYGKEYLKFVEADGRIYSSDVQALLGGFKVRSTFRPSPEGMSIGGVSFLRRWINHHDYSSQDAHL